MGAVELVKAGDLQGALAALQGEVRASPADAKKRVFLFQLLAVLGDWDRAMTQLNIAAEMDAKTLLMAQVCRPALTSEALRSEIFAGKRSPLLLGKPEPWVGWMIEALGAAGRGEQARAGELRASALDAAPAVAGTINGEAFEWIADADMRLGPILEALIDGRSYWVPFQNIHRLEMEEPADLRDVVWIPGNFTWTNGGTAVGLIPVRYPGSESNADSAVRLARKTEWVEAAPDFFVGLGQRVLTTDRGEHPLLQIREIVLGDPPPPPTPAPDAAAGQT